MTLLIKNRLLKTALLVFLAVFCLGFLAYLGGYISKFSEEGEFKNYIVYKGEEGLAKGIEEDNKEEELGEEIKNYQSFVSEEYGFKVEYPNKWRVIGIENTFNLYGVDSVRPDIFIKVINNKKELSLEDYVNKKIEQGQLAFKNGFDLKKDKISIGNLLAYRIEYLMGDYRKVETYVISENKQLLAEIFVLETDGDIRRIYNNVLEAFEFGDSFDLAEFVDEDIVFKYPKELEQNKTQVMSPDRRERNFYDYGLFRIGGLQNENGFTLKEAVKEYYYSGEDVDYEMVKIGRGEKIDALKIKSDSKIRYFFSANDFIFVFLVDEEKEVEANEVLNTLEIRQGF